ncbi:hypothetical protein G9298_28965 (plasmid) [Bacillus thuringiensis]|nr:hypothetical protein G9298_28965 [Bacillus thuringiensis]
MNSYENKNEYEILDTSQNNFNMSNRYPRYPLANNPQMPARSNHYKDWLNICDSKPIDYRRIGSSPEAYTASRDAIFTGVSITSIILRHFGLGLVSGALRIVGYLVRFLWRDNTWDNLIRHIEGIIDERISQEVLNTAHTRLAGLRNNLDDFNNALELWRINPTGVNAGRVIIEFGVTNGAFRNSMPSFSRPGYEILLLSVYAQAANLHLLLLWEYIRFATELGNAGDVDINHREQVRLMGEYTTHCVNTYRVGLGRLRGTTTAQWERFNHFRREMTLTVLDLVACFPVYDFRRYPSNTDVELSRMIYTDPVAVDGIAQLSESGGNFNALENELISPPSIVTWLDNVQIFTGEMRRTTTANQDPGIFVANVWNGNRNTFGNQGGLGIFTRTDGITTNNSTTLNMLNNDIFRVDLRAHATGSQAGGILFIYGIGRSQFFNVNRSTLIYDNPPGTGHITQNRIQNVTVSIPGESSEQPTENDYTHRLADVKNIGGGLRTSGVHGRSSLVGHGWTHISLNRRNIYAADKITKIPAVKAADFFGVVVAPGPGFTGGDLVRMDPNRSVIYEVTPANQQALQSNVGIRLRYACVGTASLRITFDNGSNQVVPLVSTTSSINNLQLGNFRFASVPNNVNFLSAGTLFVIQNISQNPNVLLDSIELFSNIPIPQESHPIPVVPEEPPFIPGEYQIVTALNNSSVFDLNSGTRVTLWSNTRGAHQIWNFTYDQQRNAYVIRNVSNPSLVLTWDFTNPSNIVFAAPFSPGRDEQYWIAESFQNGFILGNLRNRNMILDVAGGSTSPGTNIIAFPRHNGNGQRFFIRRP